MSEKDEKRKQAVLLAAERADWMQVVLNQGPPCFYLFADDGKFCLRAHRWAGHPSDHAYVSLADLLRDILHP